MHHHRHRLRLQRCCHLLALDDDHRLQSFDRRVQHHRRCYDVMGVVETGLDIEDFEQLEGKP